MVNLLNIVSHFRVNGKIDTIKPLGEGFINDTYVVKTFGDSPDYILQRKNHQIFPDVPSMMQNISKVTSHIKTKAVALGDDPMRATLTVIESTSGELYYKDDSGNYWVLTLFIDDTVTYSKADSPALALKGGEGLGKFQLSLSDFKEPLFETIKGFHNIRWRFSQWDESIRRDSASRVGSLSQEIGWVEMRRKEMLDFWRLVENGTIPCRVTHNDTKISNFLFDKGTGDVLCAIDLDTVMSSTCLNDFGDAIRSYTNTGAEDDECLENVTMDIKMFEAYSKGYLKYMGSVLTKSELSYLAFSARYITYEQVLRFLMDYIDGDTYYKIKSPDHNLVRTRAQYQLLRSIEEQYVEMCKIICSQNK
jgi:hypothetical protein